MLFDAKDDNGNIVPAAGEAGKVGWFFIVNRDNGKLIRKSEPFVKMNENMFKAPTKEGINILPGANGGAEWSPPAYSPQTHDVYVPAMDQLMKFTSAGNPETLPGTMRLGSTFVNVKDNGLQDGTFSAINVDTGKIDWQYKAPQPLIGGALATAGNLVFTGEGNGWFDAFNAKTGEKVWRYNLGAGVNAPPISLRGRWPTIHCRRRRRELPARLSARRCDRHLCAAGEHHAQACLGLGFMARFSRSQQD